MEERNDREYMGDAGNGTGRDQEMAQVRRYFAFDVDLMDRLSTYQDVTLTVEVQSGGSWMEKETLVNPDITEHEFFERAQAWLPFRGQPPARIRAYPVDNDGTALVDKSRNAISKFIPHDHSTLRLVRDEAGVASSGSPDRGEDLLRDTIRMRDQEHRRKEEALAARAAEIQRDKEETDRIRLELLSKEKDQEFHLTNGLLARGDRQNERALAMAAELAGAQVNMIKDQSVGGIQVVTQMMQKQAEEERRLREAERERLDRLERERERDREERREREEKREREERERDRDREERREREDREHRERRDRDEREWRAAQAAAAADREERRERLEREDADRRERRDREDREAKERRETEAELRRQEHESRMAALNQQALQLQIDAVRQKAEGSSEGGLGVLGKLLSMIGEDPGSALKRFLKPEEGDDTSVTDMIEALSPVLQSAITGIFGWMQSRNQPGQPPPQWAPSPVSAAPMLPSLAPQPLPTIAPPEVAQEATPETGPESQEQGETDESPLSLEEMRDARASISACIEKLRANAAEDAVTATVTPAAATLLGAWGVARCVQDQDGPAELVTKLKFYLDNKGVPCKP